MKHFKITLLLAALLGLATASFAAEPDALASGVFPSRTLQTWNLDNGTIGAQIAADGGLSYIRGLQYVWPSSHASGSVLINDGSGSLSWGSAAGAVGTLGVNRGGTGGTTAAAARANLGLPQSVTNSVLPVVNGGTGGTNAAQALASLGISGGLTTSITVVTNGTNTGTLHFTNGVLMSVTAP